MIVFAGIAFLAGVGLAAMAAKAAWHSGHEAGYAKRGAEERKAARENAPGPHSMNLDVRWPELPKGGEWRIGASREDGQDDYVLRLTPGAAEHLKIDEAGRPSREGRPLRIEIVAAEGWPVAMCAQPVRGPRYE